MNGVTQYAMVRDECPSCGEYDLGMPTSIFFWTPFLIEVQDMSPGLFEEFSPLSVGVLQISWDFA